MVAGQANDGSPTTEGTQCFALIFRHFHNPEEIHYAFGGN